MAYLIQNDHRHYTRTLDVPLPQGSPRFRTYDTNARRPVDLSLNSEQLHYVLASVGHGRVLRAMPILLNNPTHWHLRAQEARLLASQLEDSEARAATLKIAHEYDRLAVRAAKRMEEAERGSGDV
jgi:hypothetical protein